MATAAAPPPPAAVRSRPIITIDPFCRRHSTFFSACSSSSSSSSYSSWSVAARNGRSRWCVVAPARDGGRRITSRASRHAMELAPWRKEGRSTSLHRLGLRDHASEDGSVTVGRTAMGCHSQSWGRKGAIKSKSFCTAALADDAPFALAIGASILSTVVLPVSAAERDNSKEEPLLGTNDVLSGAMQIISFIPLFNWLVWVFAWLDTRQSKYLAFSAVYLAPYLKTGLSLSPDDSWLPIASILACVVHVQLDISVNIERQPILGNTPPEKTQMKNAEYRAGVPKRRFKEKPDSRDMEEAIGDERKEAEWEAIKEDAQKRELAEWDQKFSKSKLPEDPQEVEL